MVIMSVSISALDGGTSVGKYVQVAVEELKSKDIKYHVSPMETSFEVPDVRTGLDIVGEMHDAVVRAGAKRVVTRVNIDDRLDKKEDMDYKIARAKGEL